YEAKLKSLDVTPIENDRSNDWTYYSDARRRGFVLSIFGDLFADDPAGAKLADMVADNLHSRPSWYWNTQELVWGTTALGKRMQKSAKQAEAPAVLIANGKKPAVAEVATNDKSNDRSWSVYRASE